MSLTGAGTGKKAAKTMKKTVNENSKQPIKGGTGLE